MELFPLNIRGERFEVAVADNNQLRSKGLSGLPKLGSRKGMLFIWEELTRPQMVMRDMAFGLDFLFLTEGWTISKLGSLAKDATGGIAPDEPVTMVLEIPKGTIKRLGLKVGMKIKPAEKLTDGVTKFKNGGSFELVGEKKYMIKEDDVKADPDMLQILDKDGIVVANIESGSRIFSRPHTKAMIEKFKNGDKLALAELMIEIIDIQDNQKPDYVKK